MTPPPYSNSKGSRCLTHVGREGYAGDFQNKLLPLPSVAECRYSYKRNRANTLTTDEPVQRRPRFEKAKPFTPTLVRLDSNILEA